ncbi:hypothetical protein MTR_4g057010 [Medicago truncatula]|uniref:Uncharacterized protein n=1 Tax=Medicago truncatula TaxID=3880 RepID=G7JM73_MEDTR|nr:hypothetical protein MTR_4g057010 [Medicago truncatula]
MEAHAFSPSQVETFPINTAFHIHNFSFRTGSVQEEGDSRSQGGVLSSPIFSRNYREGECELRYLRFVDGLT